MDNLKAIYIVHPTWWTKMSAWFFTTFTASDMKSKLRYIDSVGKWRVVLHPALAVRRLTRCPVLSSSCATSINTSRPRTFKCQHSSRTLTDGYGPDGVLPCPALPCPTLPCPALPCPALVLGVLTLPTWPLLSMRPQENASLYLDDSADVVESHNTL